MNSDLLTNINFFDFYNAFVETGADLAVAATTYTIEVPYAVMELSEKNHVRMLKEKPTYKYHSNAGIYLLKKELLELIPDKEFFDITDLIEKVIQLKKTVYAFPIMGYWMDIGKMEDYQRAQEDIKYLKL
jgi:NDP-sugar pyrophosphorylase family protein